MRTAPEIGGEEIINMCLLRRIEKFMDLILRLGPSEILYPASSCISILGLSELLL